MRIHLILLALLCACLVHAVDEPFIDMNLGFEEGESLVVLLEAKAQKARLWESTKDGIGDQQKIVSGTLGMTSSVSFDWLVVIQPLVVRSGVLLCANSQSSNDPCACHAMLHFLVVCRLNHRQRCRRWMNNGSL